MVTGNVRAATGTAIYAPLLARGISASVISKARIVSACRHGLPYWRYPVTDETGRTIAHRYKRVAPQGAAAKYEWEPPARTDAVYNIMVVQAGQGVTLCAGEPDCWLLASMGERACSLLAGEGSVPAPAIAALAARQPGHVRVIYDNDEAGHRGAQKAALALRAAHISVSVHALPASVGHKGDLCDLYRVSDYDRQRFLQTLHALPLIEVLEPQPAQAARRSAVACGAEGPIASFKARHALADVIEASGVPLVPHQGGAYMQGRCPFHDDRSPSLVVWPQRGYFKCYGCGARGDVIDFLDRMEKGRTR